MKTKTVSSLLLLATAAAVAAADPHAASDKQLQVYPKNLARQNSGANLFLYNAANQTYVPTEAAAAWLDDDVATGWPALPGKQYYMVALPEAQLLTNFALLAKSGAGTINLYAGDDPAAPASKSWTLVARDVPLGAVNGSKLAKPFSRFAKYFLVETNLSDSGPWYSLYLYGEKPAVGYSLEKRPQAVDTHAVFGTYVNNQVAFNQSALYSNARVTYCNGGTGIIDWQKLIDDSPQDSVLVAPSTTDAGVAISYNGSPAIQRISVLTDPSAKGKLDFYLVNGGAQASGAPSLADKSPTASIVLNGSSASNSIDFPGIAASSMLVRWTPEDGKQPLALHQIDSFDDISLADYTLAGSPDAIAQSGAADDSKDMADAKDAKDLSPVADILPTRAPFVPGGLGDPPLLPANIPGRVHANFRPGTPNTPVTPVTPVTPITPVVPVSP